MQQDNEPIHQYNRLHILVPDSNTCSMIQQPYHYLPYQNAQAMLKYSENITDDSRKHNNSGHFPYNIYTFIPLLQRYFNTLTQMNSTMRLTIILAVLFLFGGMNAEAQNMEALPTVIVDGDSLPYKRLPEVRIYGDRIFKSKAHQRRWNRLYRDVKKVYPYAQLAAATLIEIDAELASLDEKADRKAFLKSKEKDLFGEFEGEIRNMTVRQGVILIKLIDRETGDTCYELIKEMKGGISAFFWQGVAKIFGSNLKYQYDPEMERDIEAIVRSIENS